MSKNKFPQPEIDIRTFRLSRLGEKQYQHLWWLLFWPVYYLRYFLVELLNPASAACHVMHCPLDDLIPLCEFFIVPYGIWMLIMLAMTFFTMIWDVDTFKKYMKFLAITITVSTTVFIVYPTCQNLRPETFERSNLFTWILGIVYQLDTNTNVCPSEHVIGSMAVLAACYHCRYFDKAWKKAGMTVLMIMISLSTVFLKQHSVLDVLYALPVCLAAYVICFKPFPFKRCRQPEPDSKRLPADRCGTE